MVSGHQTDQHACYWENIEKHRYYCLYVEKDLFGDLCLIRKWGGLHSKRGGALKEIFTNQKSLNDKIVEVGRARLRRGYRCSNNNNIYI